MATHTHSGSNGITRWFQIGRQHFTDSGKHIFREYLKALPPEEERAGRNFETHNNNVYETFGALEGVITNIEFKDKSIAGRTKSMLVVTMQDADEKYIVEIGDWDGRFSTNFMQRICSDHFRPELISKIYPYSGTNKSTGKPYFGVNIQNGVDQLEPRKFEAGTFELPAAKQTIEKEVTGPGKFTEKTVWDFSEVSNFLVLYVEKYVVPILKTDIWEPVEQAKPQPKIPTQQAENTGNGINTNVRALHNDNDAFFPPTQPGARSEPGTSTGANMDDLPF